MEIKVYSDSEKEIIIDKIIQKIIDVRNSPVAGMTKLVTRRRLNFWLNKPTRFMGKIEKKEIELDLFTFVNICNALKVSPNVLLSDVTNSGFDDTNYRKLDNSNKDFIKKLIDVLSNIPQDNSRNTEKSASKYITFDKKILGSMVKKCRLNKKYSQRKLSDDIGKTHTYINTVEKDGIDFPVSVLLDLCNSFECTPNDILRPFINNSKEFSYKDLTSQQQYIVNKVIELLSVSETGIFTITTRKLSTEELEELNKKLDKKHTFNNYHI